MKETEKIKVFVRIENGNTVCICKRSNKKCARQCDRDVVTRDKFYGWRHVMRRDKYGK